ncbi:MAG: signal peptidase I [Firmicutes bacterium]|nr:signal peptidase I [Bacillota bacterium]
MAEYRLFSRGDTAGRRRRSPYMTAAALAIVLFLVVAPEINEGTAMDPTIKDGQLLVTSKLTHYSIKRKVPEQGKIVILDKVLSKQASEDNIIARVIASDGDHVVIQDGVVTVNDEEYVTPNGIRGAEGEVDVTLEGNEVFLLCDNREEMLDSRNPKLGVVDMRKIKGNVLFRIWPLSKFGRIE